MIRCVSNPNQWHFVNSSDNVADCATRPQTVDNLLKSHWLSGPPFLWKLSLDSIVEQPALIISEKSLPEYIAHTYSSVVLSANVNSSCFSVVTDRTNDFGKQLRVVARVVCVARRWLDRTRRARLGFKSRVPIGIV